MAWCSRVEVCALVFCLLLAKSAWLGHSTALAGETRLYTVEAINDEEFDEYPPPPSENMVEYSYTISSEEHTERIPVTSTRLRNLSITLENTGPDLIRKPYLYGPRGWDFRSLEAIAAAATDDKRLTNTEKFIRMHEWKGLYVQHTVGTSDDPYEFRDFAGNPLRVLNQYGHAMCGESTTTLNGLLRAVPPVGSMYGRKVEVGNHRAGEAYFDGEWHAYDTTPGTGIIQWIYYDHDNEAIAPSWRYLIENPELVSRTRELCGFTIEDYLDGATGRTWASNQASPHWDFHTDLRPGESLTLYPEMRGRLDRTSARQDNSKVYRCYSDYGSAVFTYAPDLTSDRYLDQGAEASNVRETPEGLVPRDPDREARVTFEIRSTWCFAGAEIRASFRTDGDVYIAVNRDPYDTRYPDDPDWRRLETSTREYGPDSIEGKMVYWVQVRFSGSDSGLEELRISSEVQMSPWSMPVLEYGLNSIRFEAENLGSSRLRVTYRYDDQSSFHFYEPASGDYGRHVPIRIGGVLQQGAKVGRDDYRKGRFWQRITDTPNERVPVEVDIVKVSGSGSGNVVRTLVDENLHYGWYTFFWDGRSDGGDRLPTGMYAYRFRIRGKGIHGERLYLYDRLWPPANPEPGDDPDPDPGPVTFRRGDGNADGRLNQTDCIFVVNYLLRNGEAPPCLEAADCNDDGRVDAGDVVGLLEYLFVGGRPPADPGPADCGKEIPDQDGLSCEQFTPCEG